MKYLRVKNWETFQHYKQRNPPWIKLHNQLLSSYEFSCLHDASKAHLMLIWLLASQCDNKIPNDPAWIQRKIGSSTKPDIKSLIENNFLECYHDASNPLATCIAQTETETENKNILVEIASTEPKKKMNGHSHFDDWWKVYPKKVKKSESLKVWKSHHLDDSADELVADVVDRIKYDQRWLDGFIPDPPTYLRGKRWQDRYPPRKQ